MLLVNEIAMTSAATGGAAPSPLFNLYAHVASRRSADGSFVSTRDGHYGAGELPKDVDGFLYPEHRTYNTPWSAPRAEPERFWFVLTKSSGRQEYARARAEHLSTHLLQCQGTRCAAGHRARV